MKKQNKTIHIQHISSPNLIGDSINFSSNMNVNKKFSVNNLMYNSEIKNTYEKVSSLKHQLLKENSSINTKNNLKFKISTRPASINSSLQSVTFPSEKRNIFSEIDMNLKNLDEEVESMNKEVIRKKEIAALLKTSMWEKENLLKNNSLSGRNIAMPSKNTIDMENGEFNLNFKTQIDSINAIAIMKEKMYSKSKTKEFPKIFKNVLSKDTENEQKTIMKHIFQNKQNFNFEIFNGKKKKDNFNNLNNFANQENNFSELHQSEFSDSNSRNNFDLLPKFEVNEMVNENKIYDVEQYKQLIREKNKVEKIYRKQLMQLAQEIIESKIKKSKLEIINSDVHNECKKAKDEFHMKKDFISEKISNLEKQYNTANNKANPAVAFTSIRQSNSLVGSSLHIIPLSQNDSTSCKSILKNPVESEDKSKIIFGYFITASKLEKESILLTNQYEEIKSKLETMYEQNKKTLKEYDYGLKNSKFSFDVLSRDLRMYYLEKLGKGIDVRYDGLVWIVMRLLELNLVMEQFHFPKFLSHNHTEYLTKLSKLQIENNQLKIIFKSLKQRRINRREKESLELLAKTSEISVNPVTKRSSIYFNLPSNIRTSIDFKKVDFNSRTVNNFDKIIHKYEKFVKNVNEKKDEEIQIKKIVATLKEKILEFAQDEKVFENEKDNFIVKFFLGHEKEKDYIDEMVYLRERIENLENKISEMIKEEQKNFKLKNEKFKYNIQYNLIYSALFGNGIST